MIKCSVLNDYWELVHWLYIVFYVLEKFSLTMLFFVCHVIPNCKICVRKSWWGQYLPIELYLDMPIYSFQRLGVTTCCDFLTRSRCDLPMLSCLHLLWQVYYKFVRQVYDFTVFNILNIRRRLVSHVTQASTVFTS